MIRSDWDETTICNRCSEDVHCDDALDGTGKWLNLTLCPDCWDEAMELGELEFENEEIELFYDYLYEEAGDDSE